ncbi:MAG: phosphatidylserine/phosphatidylglycerophosphate/cardiolipin synthase family protein [Deltaproteobacteria bacterium]|nr:phosphatidylserine/phosphatidylglycerophosphate/cardiolipin synthase family protein [Deltaproteobacteria bacterium]
MKGATKPILFISATLGVLALALLFVIETEPLATVEGVKVLELLKPYPWVAAAADSRLLSRQFLLKRDNDYPELALQPETPFEAEQRLFETDVREFTRRQGEHSLRDAQLRYFSLQEYDRNEYRYRKEAPVFKSWGPLPYAPIRALPPAAAAAPFARNFLASVAYQEQLDELTHTELTSNEEVQLYQNGLAAPVMKALVQRSKKFLFINMLAVACDAATEELLAAVEAKARAGVDVRLVVHSNYALLSIPCLKRLKWAKVSIVKAMTHSSYLVNDQGEVLIGSESIARMFFNSTGYNFLDRDLMLRIKGPIATDVIQNFLQVWDDNRAGGDPEVTQYIQAYKMNLALEASRGLRGAQNYGKWLSGAPRALCRFAAQRPGGRFTALSDILLSLVRKSKERITASAVTLGRIPLTLALREAAAAGTQVDFLGNGWDGGNGELTMALDEAIQDRLSGGNLGFAKILNWLRASDMRTQARNRFYSYQDYAGEPHMRIWNYFNFVHYKAWSFDHYGVWVGSANPTEQAFANFNESGVLCIDSRLAESFASQLSLDLANSVPLPAKNMGR